MVITKLRQNGGLHMTDKIQGKKMTLQGICTRRLNVLLRFARVDPWKLNNGAFEKLRDEMFFAVFGDPTQPVPWSEGLTKRVTRGALGEAQRGLHRALEQLLGEPTAGRTTTVAELKLAESVLRICTIPTAHMNLVPVGFLPVFDSDHFPTYVYHTFGELLQASRVKASDFLHCSLCSTLFIPLRKPRKGTPTYCSPKCAGVVASRNFRKRRAAARLKKKRIRIREEKKAK
jgi:hypothetical protein